VSIALASAFEDRKVRVLQQSLRRLRRKARYRHGAECRDEPRPHGHLPGQPGVYGGASVGRDLDAAASERRSSVTEAQVEPWESGLLVHTDPAPSRSVPLVETATIIAHLRALGFDTLLLWGVARWCID
jgi:hypothetical protein